MHEKEFALLARVLPHMAARWRWHADLELPAGLPDGEIDIDALAGTAFHPVTGMLPLRLAAEMRAGLADQLERKGIDRAELTAAKVVIRFATDAVRTDKTRIVHFDFRIAARLETTSGTFTAEQDELHVWHSREPE